MLGGGGLRAAWPGVAGEEAVVGKEGRAGKEEGVRREEEEHGAEVARSHTRLNTLQLKNIVSAVAQARCLVLIRRGHVSTTYLFENT